jgi:hypothetical protein
MAVVLWVAAVVLLAAASALGEDQPSFWLRLVIALAQCVGGACLVAGAFLGVRKPLSRWAERRLHEIVGPSLIRAMPPRAVLAALLPRLYGPQVDNHEILTSILGGAGRDANGGDTAISRETFAHVRIESVSDTDCITYLTTTHEYTGIPNNYLLIIFATPNRDIARLVMSERIYPLYELWVTADEDDLEEFIPSLRGSLQIGIRYADQEGDVYDVEPRHHRGEEIELKNYDQYLRLPEHLDRKDLRILRIDLHDLADDDHVVTSVQRLAVTSSNVAAFDLGYLVWSPPHPCFVRSVTFDLSQLGRAGEDLVHLVLRATVQGAGLPVGQWTPIRNTIKVPVESWMLPGHSVTLLYRSTTTAETRHAGRRP